jgi:nicotinamide-nucleotide amidase
MSAGTRLTALSLRVLQEAHARSVMVATAESCTGGMVSAALTSVAGSSNVFERGFVTYSNRAKEEMLGVPAALIEAHGAVSQQVAQAMAKGALAHSAAQFSVSVTGIAGPGGGSAHKPVGLVHIGWAGPKAVSSREFRFPDLGRESIRLACAEAALDLLLAAILSQS